jgi:hypothetical protein
MGELLAFATIASPLDRGGSSEAGRINAVVAGLLVTAIAFPQGPILPSSRVELAASGGRVPVGLLQCGLELPRRLPRLRPLRVKWREALPGLAQPLPCPVPPALQLDAALQAVDRLPQRIQARIKSAAAVPPSVPARSASTITPVCIPRAGITTHGPLYTGLGERG